MSVKKQREPEGSELPAGLASPARRALEAAGIFHLEDFGKLTEGEVARLHGIGPQALRTIKAAMKRGGVDFAVPGIPVQASAQANRRLTGQKPRQSRRGEKSAGGGQKRPDTAASEKNPATIDDYIRLFPPDVQEIMEKVRATIRQAAPDAEEAISYQIPTFKLNGNLVHFAAYEKHIGFYPTSSGIEKFKKELSGYKGAKGSVQFPLNQPMPLDLIRKITIFRVAENLEKAAARGKKKDQGFGKEKTTGEA